MCHLLCLGRDINSCFYYLLSKGGWAAVLLVGWVVGRGEVSETVTVSEGDRCSSRNTRKWGEMGWLAGWLAGCMFLDIMISDSSML